MNGSAIHTAIVQAASILTTALPGVDVFDGINASNLTPGTAVYVGVESALDVLTAGSPFPVSADGSSDWASLGARARDENFNIRCCVFGWSGGGTVATVRGTVFGLYAQVEGALRGNVNLNGAVLFSGASVTTVRSGVSDRGPAAETQFVIVCKARI